MDTNYSLSHFDKCVSRSSNEKINNNDQNKEQYTFKAYTIGFTHNQCGGVLFQKGLSLVVNGLTSAVSSHGYKS